MSVQSTSNNEKECNRKHVNYLLKRGSQIPQLWLDQLPDVRRDRLLLVPLPTGEKTHSVRNVFDKSLEEVHNAGACRRVGRCMRLLVVDRGNWVGGIVLGSTFPNIHVRDAALGLKIYILDCQSRNLRSPWARENFDYWKRLQKIVNHARTFILPKFQGQGLGIRAHRLLINQGVRHWEQRYRDRVAAFDTLCDVKDSQLFLRNGWIHVGKTAGFEPDPKKELVSINGEEKTIKNNIGLCRGKHSWEVWIRVIDASAFDLEAA